MAKKSHAQIRFVKFLEISKSLILGLLSLLGKFFKFLFELFKSIWLGISVLIISLALLISSIGVFVWMLSNATGLEESERYQEYREQYLDKTFDHWEFLKKRSDQQIMANKLMLEIAEVTTQSCEQDNDCQTPNEYLIRSSCAYQSRCLVKECVVVCPKVR